MPPSESLKAQVDKCIADAVRPHPWLYDVIVHDATPDPEAIGVDGAISGIFAVLAGLTDAVMLLASEIEKQNASR